MTSISQIDQVMQQSASAFQVYRNSKATEKAALLRAIATQIEALGDELITVAQQETHLPEARLKNERGRTTGQLALFAQLIETGDWVQARIDTGDPDRKPAPKPDLRKMLFPVGPVIVFGASNFPFAFSTAGGDTASALAAGCPVVVKSHPGHPKTSALVAKAIQRAIAQCQLPPFVFQHVDDPSIEAGQHLVKHPLTKSVAFTGSYTGGKALFDLAASREEPIPVFAEMGSINPVVLLPEIVRTQKSLPGIVAASILLGVGQFCTNPGLLLVVEEDGLSGFLDELAMTIGDAAPGKMLHKGIATNYQQRKTTSLSQSGVSVMAQAAIAAEEEVAGAVLATVTARDFIANPMLREEVFGPYSLVVRCTNVGELNEAIAQLRGQLTATVFGMESELSQYAESIELLHQRCGRLIYNSMPTGVEVCSAMQHGGPFPATTDARFTSVGTDAIYRFVRPVCYQDFPQALLPAELQNHNPLQIWRSLNGTWTKESVGSQQ